jgi:hypothetical protein
LERIGRDNYQQALDACHVLTVEPSKDEADWIDGAKTIYGLIDFVTRKVSTMRQNGRGKRGRKLRTTHCTACWNVRPAEYICPNCHKCLDTCCDCE